MAGSSDIKAGGAFVELGARSEKFMAGLRAAENRFKSFGASIMAIGGKMAALDFLKVAPFLLAAKHAATVGSELVDMSDRTGMSVEALSGLQYAAGQSGASLEDLATSIKKMQHAIGDDESGKMFGELGLSLAALSKLSPEDQFSTIAEAISKLESPAKRTKAAMDIFGKTGTQLLPLFKEGAGGIAELTQRAKDLGLVMSTEDAKAAEEFGDSLQTVKDLASRFTTIIGSSLIPSLKGVVNGVINCVSTAMKWVDTNRGLVVGLAGAAAACIAVETGVVGVGLAIWGTGQAVGLIVGMLSAIGSVATLAVSGFTALVGALATSPFLAAGAAIVGLTAYLYGTGPAAQEAGAALKSNFEEAKADVITSLGTIKDALASGDLSTAAKIGMKLVEVEWVRIVNLLKGTWASLTAEMKIQWLEWSTFVQTKLIEVGAGIEKLASKAVETGMGWFDKIQKATNDFEADVLGTMTDEGRKALNDAIDRNQPRRAKAHEAWRGAADKEKDDMVKALTAEKQAKQDEAKTGADKRVAELKLELDKLQKELQTANADAKNAAVQAINGADGKPRTDFGIADPNKNGKTLGTFNASLIPQLFGPGSGAGVKVEEKQLKAQELANKLLVEIKDGIRKGMNKQIVFEP